MHEIYHTNSDLSTAKSRFYSKWLVGTQFYAKTGGCSARQIAYGIFAKLFSKKRWSSCETAGNPPGVILMRQCSKDFFTKIETITINLAYLTVISIKNSYFFNKIAPPIVDAICTGKAPWTCKLLRNRHKRHKKTACNRQHFCKQRICSGGADGSRTHDLYDANVSL